MINISAADQNWTERGEKEPYSDSKRAYKQGKTNQAKMHNDLGPAGPPRFRTL